MQEENINDKEVKLKWQEEKDLVVEQEKEMEVEEVLEIKELQDNQKNKYCMHYVCNIKRFK